MDFISLLSTAFALSMDAFAVAITKGIVIKNLKVRHALKVGIFFGAFQALMPFLGWAAGIRFSKYIKEYDHWIAFALLLFIGGKMLIEGIREIKENKCETDILPEKDSSDENALNNKELTVLAIATSIDALAVGVTLALSEANILISTCIIGIVTFIICFAGVFIGKKTGCRFQNKADVVGGLILVLIGTKILFEHTGAAEMLMALFH